MLSCEAGSCGAAEWAAGEALAFDDFVTLETGFETIFETIISDPLRYVGLRDKVLQSNCLSSESLKGEK
jgi:hypothetical protein